MLSAYIDNILCALRGEESARPYLMMGLLAFGILGVALGRGGALHPYRGKFYLLIGMTVGVLLGAAMAALVEDVCGPWRG